MPLNDDQKRMRKTGITSTDSVKIMFGHVAEVYLDKTSDEIAPDSDDETKRAGRFAEPEIVNMWYDSMPKPHKLSLYECGTVRNEKEPWMIATPDRIVSRSAEEDLPPALAHLMEDFAVAEIKNLTPMSPHRYKYTDEDAALKDIVQSLWHCTVTGMNEFFIIARFDGWRLRPYRYTIDGEMRRLQNIIIDKCRYVWHEVILPRRYDLIDTEPHPEFAKLIERENAPREGAVLTDIDLSMQCVVDEWLRLSAQAAENNLRIATLENEIKRAMAEKVAMVDAEGKTLATWKPNKNGVRVFRRVAVEREKKDTI